MTLLTQLAESLDSIVTAVFSQFTNPRSIDDFIKLVERVERTHPSASTVEIAEIIFKTGYNNSKFKFLCPDLAFSERLEPAGEITAADVTFIVSKQRKVLVGSAELDPLHILAPLVGFEAGIDASEIGMTDVTVAEIFSWVADVGKAAAGWILQTERKKHPDWTTEDYWQWSAPDSDLVADIHGCAMLQAFDVIPWAFDPGRSLSRNLQSFYLPTFPETGVATAYHEFCKANGFALEVGDLSLTEGTREVIRGKIKQFALFFAVGLSIEDRKWSILLGYWPTEDPIDPADIQTRMSDWKVFADRFITFVEDGLARE